MQHQFCAAIAAVLCLILASQLRQEFFAVQFCAIINADLRLIWGIAFGPQILCSAVLHNNSSCHLFNLGFAIAPQRRKIFAAQFLCDSFAKPNNLNTIFVIFICVTELTFPFSQESMNSDLIGFKIQDLYIVRYLTLVINILQSLY